MAETELLPCKYCGRKGTIRRTPERITIECESNDYEVVRFTTAEDCERKAIEVWNRRLANE